MAAPGFKSVLLICAMSVSPPDCQVDSALSVISGPDAGNELACMMQSQAYLAGSVLGRDLPDDEYLKIKCMRRKTENSVAENRSDAPPGTEPLSTAR